MKRKYLDILCCPHCHGELILKIMREEKDEVVEGTLTCTGCHTTYDIREGIPVMIKKE